MRDVHYGWLIRYVHSNVLRCFLLLFIFISLESFFFIVSVSSGVIVV